MFLVEEIDNTSPQPGGRGFLGGVCMHYNIDH